MRYVLTFVILSLIPITGFTETRKGTVKSKVTTRPHWAFLFETRPSFPSKVDKAYTENLAELGVRVHPDLYVGYQQSFTTNLYNSDPTLEDGAQLKLSDGYLTTQIKNIWKSRTTSFSLEPRLYLPTDETLRDNGMLARVRTHFNLRFAPSTAFAFHFIEVPIFHIYDRAGTGTSEATYSANPSYENRLYLATDITFASWCSLWIPLRLKSTRFSKFRSEAKNNDSWSHIVTLYPELTFNVSSKLALGLAFETANLMTEKLESTSISDGFANGISQVFLRLSF